MLLISLIFFLLVEVTLYCYILKRTVCELYTAA